MSGHALRAGLLPFTRRHRPMLARGLVFTCVLVGSRLALPLPLGGAVEQSTPAAVRPALLPEWSDPVAVLGGLFVLLALLAGMAEHFQRLAFAHFASRSINDARAAALVLVTADGSGQATDPAARVMADSVRAKQALKGLLNHLTLNALLVLGACVALAVVDVYVGLVQLAGTAVVVAVAVLGARRVAVVAAQHQEGEALLAGAVHQFVGPGGRSLDELAELHALDSASADADIAMTRWEGRTTWVVHGVLTVTAAAVMVVGLQAVAAGRIGTGGLFSVVAYLLVLHGPAVRLARQVARIGPLRVSATKLGAVLVPPAFAVSPQSRTYRA